jgi:hypothetical protein
VAVTTLETFFVAPFYLFRVLVGHMYCLFRVLYVLVASLVTPEQGDRLYNPDGRSQEAVGRSQPTAGRPCNCVERDGIKEINPNF